MEKGFYSRCAFVGLMALPRSPLEDAAPEDNDIKDAADVVDASTLPPG